MNKGCMKNPSGQAETNKASMYGSTQFKVGCSGGRNFFSHFQSHHL